MFSVKGKLGNLGLSLIVAAAGVQNSVAAATAATTSLGVFCLKESVSQKSSYFLGVLAGSFFSGLISIFSGFVVLV